MYLFQVPMCKIFQEARLTTRLLSRSTVRLVWVTYFPLSYFSVVSRGCSTLLLALPLLSLLNYSGFHTNWILCSPLNTKHAGRKLDCPRQHVRWQLLASKQALCIFLHICKKQSKHGQKIQITFTALQVYTFINVFMASILSFYQSENHKPN